MRSQSKEKPSRSAGRSCARAQRVTHSAGGLPVGDRPELGGQAEGVEAEREQHWLPPRALEARVGVSDRVAAHVPDVDVPGGERRRGLDVDALRPSCTGGVRKACGSPTRAGGAARSRGDRSRPALRSARDRCPWTSNRSHSEDIQGPGSRTRGVATWSIAMLESTWPPSPTGTRSAPRRPPLAPPCAGSSRPRSTARIL